MVAAEARSATPHSGGKARWDILGLAQAMVLTTPDAQRSFLSFFDSGKLYMTQSIANAIIASSMVVIEGYMLELPGAHCWLPE
ncbi:uncharacterized protein HaLaN_05880, partial [Haematococcus lacustris]